MASRYWVGGTAAWDGTAGSKWAATSGGAGGQNAPTASDDVFIDANSGAVTVDIQSLVTINSLNCTGFTGTLSASAFGQITFTGSLTLVSGMTCSVGNMNLIWQGTGSVVWTFGGKAFGNKTLNGTGTVTLGDAMPDFKSFTHTKGTFTTNNFAVSIGSYTNSGSSARALNLGSSAVEIQNNSGWQVSGSNFTLNAGTSVITLSSIGVPDFAGNGLTYYDVIIGSVGGGFIISSNITGANTFHNLTILNVATQVSSAVYLGANQTVTNTFTVTGANQVSRIWITSDTIGTPRTITAAAVSLSNVDFADITGAGAATWSGSSIGNATGNTNISFTTPTTRYWVGNTGYWSGQTGNRWATSSGGASGASMPLPQDAVIFDANSITSASQSIVCDVPRAGGNITFNGVLNTPLWNMNVNTNVYGNLTLGTMTTGGFVISMAARANVTLNPNGIATMAGSGLWIANLGFTVTLSANLVMGQALSMRSGTFDAATFNVTVPSVGYAVVNSAIPAKTITMGSGTWTLNGTGTVWSVGFNGSAYVTINPGTSTIKITDSSATDKTFNGVGLTYYNIWNATGSTGKLIIDGSNTFNNFKSDAGRTNRFTAGTTQTATTFTILGTAGNLITLESTSTSAYGLRQTTGIIDADYLSYSRSTVSGGAIWYAGTHSTDGGNNSGWHFRWTNPTNAYSSNNAYATAPATSAQLDVYLSKDGGLHWQNVLSKTFTSSDSVLTYGTGASELWGSSWTDVDVNNTNFRLRIQHGQQVQIYSTFGSGLSSGDILTGIEVAIEAKETASVFSVDNIAVTFHAGGTVTTVQPGSIAYASNGRKNGEGAGLGTGVVVFRDASAWRAVDTGATVAA